MKKTFTILAVALMALSACNKEGGRMPGMTEYIAFDSYTGGVTRTASITTENIRNFGAAAYTGSVKVMDNQLVEGGNGAWSYSPIKYWPQSGALYFSAYAPYATASNGITPSYNTSTRSFDLSYAMPADEADQVDLLMAQNVDVADCSAHPAKVQFTFGHILSRIGMTARYTGTASAGTTVTLTDIKFSGKFIASGDYTVSGGWANQAASASTVIYDRPAARLAATSLTSSAQNLLAGDDYVMLIPNGDGASDSIEGTITVSYTIKTSDDTEESYVKDSHVSLSCLPNKTYIFNLIIDLDADAIQFGDVTVLDWGAEQGLDVTVGLELITFADPEVKRLLVGEYDTDSDGEISVKEARDAAAIPNTLFAGNTTITSFDELHYFTNTTQIATSSFSDCTSLRSINLSRVTEIKPAAFSGCGALTDVTFSPALASLSMEAFYNCDLAEFPGGTSISFIGERAFMNNRNMTGTVDLSHVNIISQNAFTNCENVSGYTLPTGNFTVGLGAFSFNKSITSLSAPGLVVIPEEFAKNCDMLSSVSIGSAASIGANAFREDAQLTTVSVPLVTSIGDNAFRSCTGLVTLAAGPALKTIGTSTFNGCTSLTSVSGGYRLTKLNNYSFMGCTALETYDIGDVTVIPMGCFQNCINLTSIGSFDNIERVEPWAMLGSKVNVNTFPALKYIGETIGGYVAGEGFSKVCSGVLSAPVLEFIKGENNWSQMKFTKIEDLGSITDIPEKTFYNCVYVEEAILPATVQTIGKDAFAQNNSLTTIVCNAVTPPVIDAETFKNSTAIASIYVPDDSVDDYKAAENWSEHASKIKPLSSR